VAGFVQLLGGGGVRYVIIGCGTIGMELARIWAAAGHEVTGTTTTLERLPEVARVCKEAVLLEGTDRERVAAVAGYADAVVLAARPRIRDSMTRRGRSAEYRGTLVGSAHAVVAAHRRVVFLSSIAVYGDGGAGRGPIDEHSPRSIDLEPAAQHYAAAERVVLESGHGLVLRLPDVYGPAYEVEDEARLRLGHELGGALPVAAEALHYWIDYRDAAQAAAFGLGNGLTGIYNAVPDADVPPTVAARFDRLADEAGLPRLRYTAEVKTPTRPVTSAKLRATGFTFTPPG
jgi:nucleoside-diphosphate-sugar epimerase